MLISQAKVVQGERRTKKNLFLFALPNRLFGLIERRTSRALVPVLALKGEEKEQLCLSSCNFILLWCQVRLHQKLHRLGVPVNANRVLQGTPLSLAFIKLYFI